MIRLRALSALSCLLVGGALTPTLAQSWTKKAYDATYEMSAAGQVSTMRMISDGQGHQRHEVAGNRAD